MDFYCNSSKFHGDSHSFGEERQFAELKIKIEDRTDICLEQERISMASENETLNRIEECRQSSIGGEGVSPEDALWLLSLPDEYSPVITDSADTVREKFRGKLIDPCTVMNAKSGACSEDCHFCAQSSHFRTIAPTYNLLAANKIVDAARAAQQNGTRRFCIGTSGRSLENPTELRVVEDALGRMHSELGLWACATLGSVSSETVSILKEAGLDRLHHNLETSRNHFPKIVSTHAYDERVSTVRMAKEAGISVCSGGIFGVGESNEDRVSLFSLLREIDVDSIPINFLVPIAGTPLAESNSDLDAEDALRIIAVSRLFFPTKEVRVCGGRVHALGDRHPEIFNNGADGVMIGNYLTRSGRSPDLDIQMIHEKGFNLVPPHVTTAPTTRVD